VTLNVGKAALSLRKAFSFTTDRKLRPEGKYVLGKKRSLEKPRKLKKFKKIS